MKKQLLFVGLDVHAKNITMAEMRQSRNPMPAPSFKGLSKMSHMAESKGGAGSPMGDAVRPSAHPGRVETRRLGQAAAEDGGGN